MDGHQNDRQGHLRAAEEWRAQRKPKKAIAELRHILEREPRDAVAHARLAPLLVATGDARAAIPSLRIAARDLEARGFADKAVSLHLQLAAIDPADLWAWETASRLHASRGRTAEAVKVLMLGARRQRAPAPAARLVRQAAALAPDDVELLLELARRTGRAGAVAEARTAVQRALTLARGAAHRRARWIDFLLSPGVRTFWRWLLDAR